MPRRYRARRPRRYIKRRGRKSKSKLNQERSYRFKMTLLPTCLVSTFGTATGTFDITSRASFPAPVKASTQSTPIAAITGFPYYYDYGMGLPFALSDLENYLAYTQIFDAYKINSITMKITYLANSANVLGQSVLPTVWVIQDKDDSDVPTTQQKVSARQGARKLEFGMKASHSITIRPKLSVLNSSSGTSAVGFQQGAGWVDCNSPSATYHGLKLWFVNVPLVGNAAPANSPNMGFQFEFVYNCSFKGALNEF